MEKSIVIIAGQGGGKSYILNKIRSAFGISRTVSGNLQLLSKLIREDKIKEFDLYVYDGVNYKTLLNHIVALAKEHDIKFLISSLCNKHDLPEYIKENFEIIDLREVSK